MIYWNQLTGITLLKNISAIKKEDKWISRNRSLTFRRGSSNISSSYLPSVCLFISPPIFTSDFSPLSVLLLAFLSMLFLCGPALSLWSGLSTCLKGGSTLSHRLYNPSHSNEIIFQCLFFKILCQVKGETQAKAPSSIVLMNVNRKHHIKLMIQNGDYSSG